MGDIASLYENVGFSPNVFVAYPGIPIWPGNRGTGLTEPSIARGMGANRAGRKHTSLVAAAECSRGCSVTSPIPPGRPDEESPRTIALPIGAKLPGCAPEAARVAAEALLVRLAAGVVALDGASLARRATLVAFGEGAPSHVLRKYSYFFRGPASSSRSIRRDGSMDIQQTAPAV